MTWADLVEGPTAALREIRGPGTARGVGSLGGVVMVSRVDRPRDVAGVLVLAAASAPCLAAGQVAMLDEAAAVVVVGDDAVADRVAAVLAVPVAVPALSAGPVADIAAVWGLLLERAVIPAQDRAQRAEELLILVGRVSGESAAGNEVGGQFRRQASAPRRPVGSSRVGMSCSDEASRRSLPSRRVIVPRGLSEAAGRPVVNARLR